MIGRHITLLERLSIIPRKRYVSVRGDAPRHVTGKELLEGIREYALKQFGPLAMFVLNEWGIHRTEDFGEIVFNMVDAGLLLKTKDDKKEDFANGYDFEEVFKKPFLPESKQVKGLPVPKDQSQR